MKVHFKDSYDADIEMFEDRAHALRMLALVALAFVLPFFVGTYYLGEITLVMIWCVAGMGLMLLTGHTGQASLGHAAFLAIGAFSNIQYMELGIPFLLALPLAGITTGVIGAIIARPILRTHGIYLAIATIALSIIVEDVAVLLEPITGGVIGVQAPVIEIFGLSIDRYATPEPFYWLCLIVTILVTLGYVNVLRSPTGRAFVAVRDSEVSARALGVNITRTKTLAFGLSTAVTGLAGALYAHYVQFVNYESFLILISITLVLQIVVGGLGFIQGAFFGAVVVGVLPQALSILSDWLQVNAGVNLSQYPGLDTAVFALLIVLIMIYEPMGLYGRWLKIRTYFEIFPLYRRDMFRRQKSYLKTERMR
ncbi:MAG: branched-chain amino acid ABC transporter permease [Pseudomonadota bacterium]